jgi:general secretion pathway protein E
MLNIPKIENVDFEPIWLEDVDIKLALKYYVLFSVHEDNTIVIVTLDHIELSLDFLAKVETQYPIYQTDSVSFERLYNKFLEIRTDKSMSDDSINDEVEEDIVELKDFLQTNQDLLDSEDAAPIIKLVNSIFYQAIKSSASDIHIQMHEKNGEIRFRIDGALNKYIDINKKIAQLVVSRIKVISNLDISEKRIPQDGRTSVTIAHKKLDIRVSILPTYYGERVVMRILMESEDIPTLENLGFESDLAQEFGPLLKHPHGMILVTGPTGSGKSTTLHSFLQTMATPDKNVITVEDPVEYNAHNISQVQANEKVNLTFATALRSILRQDPDIVMVGEIRDQETANISIQAALTGHLVLSTLHTNTSTGAITRLADMGVDDYLISSALIGVLSQRLVRRLCVECKGIDTNTVGLDDEFGIDITRDIYKAIGCNQCNFTGYKGRIAIGELFIIDDDVKHLIKQTQDEHNIREKMREKGLVTIQDRLVRLIENGITSFEEALRIGIYQ